MTEPSVTHVLWTGAVGGIERLTHDLAVEQAAQGIAVSIALGQARGPFAERMRDAGLPVVDLGFRSGYDLVPARVGRAARSLRRSDVIHLHAFNAPLGSAVTRARRPVVFTEHGNFGVGRDLGLADAVKRRAQRRFLRRSVAAIAANSRFTARRLGEIYGIDPRTVTVIHNGVDMPAGEPSGEPNGSDGELSVVFVGRVARMKRIDRLLEAAAKAARVRLTIVGGGPLESELREMAARLGIADRVSFLGYRDDVGGILDRADVLVQPTAGEPFGLAIVEAAARGVLPMAFGDGGGALEVLPPGGRVVDDPGAMAAAFEELIGSPELSAQARRERAEWVRGRFPIEACARRYLDLYRAAAGGRAALAEGG